jgi:hypothetical protein
LGLETEPTDINNNIDKVTKDVEKLIDYANLLANKVYLLEYYLRQIEEFNKSKFTTKDYTNSTTLLLN